MSKIKTLHITKYYPPFKGGIENFLQDLLECEAVNERCDTRVLAHHHDQGITSVTESIGDIPVRRVKLWRQMLYAPICLSFRTEMIHEMKQFNPDVLHIHMPNLSALLCLFSKDARRRPWVIHWHSDVLGAEPDWRIKLLYPLYRIFEKRLLSRARRIICTSPSYLGSSKSLVGFEHKCRVIPLGIRANSDKRSFDPVPGGDQQQSPATLENENSQGSGLLQILCVGRLTYYKGHKYLLDAIAKLNDVHLTIIGEGEMRADIEAQISQLGLEKRVTLAGEVSDSVLTDCINTSDLLCLPSIERTEAFGMVILEAARCKKPTIVTGVAGSGMSWVVVDKVTGWVVPDRDVTALKNCIEQIDSDRSQISAFGEAAQKRFLNNFQIDSVGGEVVALYSSIVH